MKRTKLPSAPTGIKYSVEEEPIVLSKPLLDTFLSQPNPGNLIALYSFYYYTAKWQKTNQPKATINYVAKGIKWGIDKVRAVKKELKRLGLVEDIIARGKDGRVTAHYIKVNFIWKTDSIKEHHPMDSTRGGKTPCLEKSKVNALSYNNINTLSYNNPEQKSPCKVTLQKRNEIYLPIVKYLSKTSQTNKNIQHTSSQLKTWSNDIRRLVENNKVSIKRIKEVLKWYKQNIGGEYIPVIESGSSLREKFTRLEDAMQRGTGHHSKPSSIIESGRKWYLEADGEYYNKDGEIFTG